MAEEATNIKEAVDNAVKEITSESKKEENIEEAKETLTEKEGEETPEETEETSEEEKDEVDEIVTKNALTLWDSLNGKDAKKVIANLAAAKGLQLAVSEESSKEGASKEAIKSTLDILKKHFGDKYDMISKPLSGAIDEILRDRVESKFENQEAQDYAQSVDTEFGKLKADKGLDINTEEGAAIEARMSALANKFQHDPSTITIKEYLDGLYRLALTDNGLSNKLNRIKKVKKTNKNEADRDLPPSGVSTKDTVVKRPDKPTVKQAVEAASRGELWQ